MDEEKLIKKAWTILTTPPTSVPSAQTVSGYIQIASLMVRRAGKGAGIEGLLVQAKKTSSIRTWNRRRAALKYVSRQYLGKLISELEAIKNVNEATETARSLASRDDLQIPLKKITDMIEFCIRLWNEPGIPLENRRRRHSKRRDLRGLPVDWRERIVARMPTYRLAALTSAVTGCRPEELVRGVALAIEGDMLVVTIQGAKVTARTGQPWRRLFWKLSNEWSLVRLLIREVQSGATMATIKDAKAYSNAMRAAGQREWPRRKATVTPYCCRHAFASDMKAAGMDGADISAALGHCSDVARQFYGSASQGRTRAAIPLKVEAARPVRITIQPKPKPSDSNTDRDGPKPY